MSTNNNKDGATVPDADLFLIYSDAESAMNAGPMFWSNTDGWGDLARATKFTASEQAALSLPRSAGNHARWIPYPDALMKDWDVAIASQDDAVCALKLSLSEAAALRICITEFIRSERLRGISGLGGNFIQSLQPVRRQLIAGHRTVKLTLLNFALASEALQREITVVPNAQVAADVYEQAINGLRRRFSAHAKMLGMVERLNVYTHDFNCTCPVNGAVIQYRIVIESENMIPVEEVVALAAAHPVSYHEALAEEFYKAFGGSQRMSAFHHGVHIKTIRTDDKPL